MLFRGRWDYQLDDRNRMPIPPAYREPFAAKAVLVQGTESCIEMYTEEGWSAQAAVLEKIPMESAAAREAARAFFGSSMDVQPDAQGRLVIPGFLLEDASITKEVRVIGRNHCLEIWDRQAWEGMQDRLRQTRLAVLDSIAANAQGQQGAVP